MDPILAFAKNSGALKVPLPKCSGNLNPKKVPVRTLSASDHYATVDE
jgi:hypothetical protein